MARRIETVITPYSTTPSRLRSSTFSADRDVRLAEENIRNGQLNDIAEEINNVAEDIEILADNTTQNATLAISKAQEANASANAASLSASAALAAKGVIEGYVVPTEATYSEQTIDAKIKMAIILNMTGA